MLSAAGSKGFPTNRPRNCAEDQYCLGKMSDEERVFRCTRVCIEFCTELSERMCMSEACGVGRCASDFESNVRQRDLTA